MVDFLERNKTVSRATGTSKSKAKRKVSTNAVFTFDANKIGMRE